MKAFIVLQFLLTSFSAFSMSNENATALVNNKLKNVVVNNVRHYCIQGTMTCRSIFTYKDKETNFPVSFFRISFYSSERQVAGSEYYSQVGYSLEYNRFIDTTFDGNINITKSDEVQIVLRRGNEIIIKDLMMPKLGTTQYLVSDLIFNDKMASLEGITKDTTDPTVNLPVRIEYLIQKK